ncbi:hypothetical protein ACQQ97_04190 [Anaerovoracaceae bacterium SGI.195]
MRHLREFIYDKSDILVALVILIIAGLLIFWRFEAIADYPSTLVKSGDVQTARDNSDKTRNNNNASKAKEKKPSTDKDGEKESDKSGDDKNSSGKTDSKDDSKSSESSSAIYDGGVTGRATTVIVQSGSATDAVNSLVNAGYFDSYDDFVSTCQSLGIDSGSIKAGTFSIPAGSGKNDVARIVCAL